MFARYGVKEYWIVDPVAAQIELRALDGGTYRLHQVASREAEVRSATFAGLSFSAAKIFQLR